MTPRFSISFARSQVTKDRKLVNKAVIEQTEIKQQNCSFNSGMNTTSGITTHVLTGSPIVPLSIIKYSIIYINTAGEPSQLYTMETVISGKEEEKMKIQLYE